MKCNNKFVSQPVPADLGLTVDQMLTKGRVGKSTQHTSVESTYALVTNLFYPESSIPILSPIPGPFVLCPVPGPSLDPLVREERVDKSPTYKVTRDSEGDPKINLSYTESSSPILSSEP